MARRRAKVKRMTITQQYNRYAIGLKYYGQDLETKTRATRKQLKEIKKLSSQIRQEQRAQGITDLPTIAQAYKYITEQQEKTKEDVFKKLEQQFENYEATELEPLPYSDEPLDMRNFEYPIIEELLQVLYDVMEDSEERFNYVSAGTNNPAVAIRNLCTQLSEAIAQILDNPQVKENFATYLSSSLTFETLKTVKYYRYEEIINALEDMTDVLKGLVDDFNGKASQEPPFIAPTDIRFDV